MSIVLEGVRKSFRGTPVISIDKLDIPKSAQWIITGASGSGKTTFLNLVSGILAPDAGSITVSGTEITRLGEADRDRFRARSIGIVFQTFNLLQGFTALENVLLGMLFADKVDPDRADALLDRVGLKDKRGQNPDTLSVGQQQRVAIARALANKPEILLADEPTGNLDPKTGESIIGLLKEVCRENGTTLLCVTHQPQVMQSFKDVTDLSCLSGR
ncbi:MAG TPA: ABC transporter ATP-binding protein [Planctomycetota bacterium]|nr:ABC transporter ATP-binding protein [Planctomycetota bacterium]